MTELVISRLSATVPGSSDDQDRGPRVQRLLARVAEHRLDDALGRVTLPAGDWCVRRVDVALPLDLDRPDPAIEAQWARALVDAVRAALVAGSPDVAHFRRVPEALADLVSSVAQGRVERAWAWTEVGLLRPGDPPLGSAAAGAVLAALRRHPESALVAVVAAVRVAGAAAVHRLLGARGWAELAAVVLAALAPAAATMTFEPTSEPTGASVPQDGEAVLAPGPAPAAILADALTRRATLAAEFRRSRVRPDAVTAWAWAVLVAAEADPAVLRRTNAPAVVAELASRLHSRTATPQTGTESDSRIRSVVNIPGSEPEAAAPTMDTDGTELDAPTRAVDAPPGDVDEATTASNPRWPTPWAGLLFLLSTAAEAGVPDDLLTDPPLAGRPLWWVLHAVATRLVPATPDDPAVLTLAGLPPDHELDTAPPTEDEAMRLDQHAQRWATVTAARLDRKAEDPLQMITEVALRRGDVLAEPGWIEIYLRHDEVDIAVRRAGLDVDPGWVPWLGTVVRFVYE